MRRIALVTAYFPPSNLVGVHRARIWAQHLPEFGWAPTVVTAHWKYYQEPLDWTLLDLVPEDVRVIRTKALGLGFAKIIGNMALRSLWWTTQELVRLAQCNELDFIHIIVPDHYSALLGRLVHRSNCVPYGIDYMDPWVHASPGEKPFLSKAWFSCALSYYLEPWATKSARLITGVSQASYEGVLRRNPTLNGNVVTAEVPMANPASDYCALSKGYTPSIKLFDPNDGLIHIIYAGAIPANFKDSLECFLAALRKCIDEAVFSKDVRVYLIGTGTPSHGTDANRVDTLITALSLKNHVTEYPSRIGYLDVLWHLRAATAVLVLGSTERHYTPSKLYQAVQTNNPVLALVPHDGRAAEILTSSGNGIVVNFPDKKVKVIEGIEQALSVIANSDSGTPRKYITNIEQCAARLGARRLADALNSACDS
jgi:putative hemolysin